MAAAAKGTGEATTRETPSETTTKFAVRLGEMSSPLDPSVASSRESAVLLLLSPVFFAAMEEEEEELLLLLV